MYPYYTKYLNNFQLEAVYIIIDICIRILRHYDELGLLVPKSTDFYTSYSYYSEEQLLIASRITALMDMGFSLAAI
jgi:DNA-binding transcriptional MerR regulator